jgi:hypothetical protein
VFHDEDTNDFKGTQVAEHQILLGDAKPIRKLPYRIKLSEGRNARSDTKGASKGRHSGEHLSMVGAGTFSAKKFRLQAKVQVLC